VKIIFDLYLLHQSLQRVCQELEKRGWKNKRWTARKGHELGGQPFCKTTLHRLLTNVAYIGKVRYKDEVHPGEHTAIVVHGEKVDHFHGLTEGQNALPSEVI
jgi:site-specific DNA recombinase